MPATIQLTATIERKHPKLPRFVVVPSSLFTPWKLEQTTIVDATLNRLDIGRRSLKKWDEERWFIELTEPMCEKQGVDTGDQIVLGLRIASAELPAELAKLIAKDGKAKKVWAALTPSSQRMVREHVGQATQPSTRERRARQALGLDR